jgi:uncharacterized short protein YbdD (DUF466 family)
MRFQRLVAVYRAAWGWCQTFALRFRQTARLMVGVPDYRCYCDHMRQLHPERVPMSEPEFFRNRMDARYGQQGDRSFRRCC